MGKNYKVYTIHCAKCSTYILTYHKFGAGKGILRLYFANIVAPDNLASLARSDFERISQVPNLQCPACQEVIGVSATSKGKRWVFRMRKGYFHRKIQKK